MYISSTKKASAFDSFVEKKDKFRARNKKKYISFVV